MALLVMAITLQDDLALCNSSELDGDVCCSCTSGPLEDDAPFDYVAAGVEGEEGGSWG